MATYKELEKTASKYVGDIIKDWYIMAKFRAYGDGVLWGCGRNL